MPVYEYECSACEKVFEVQQRMADAPLTICPECKGEVKKIVSRTSFRLKGGGWFADGYCDSSSKSSAKSTEAPSCPSGGCCAGCSASAS